MLARLPTPAGKIVIYYAGPGTKIYGIERLLKELTRGTSVPVVRADISVDPERRIVELNYAPVSGE